VDFEQLSSTLEPDERVIYTWMYVKRPWLYSAVLGEVYMLRGTDHSTNQTVLDFVDGRWLTSALKRNPEYKVADKLLLVRVRGSMGPGLLEGELLTRDELYKDRDAYTILDVYIMAVSKTPPLMLHSFSVDDYQYLKDEFELVDVGYVVAPHSPKKLKDIL
jgi:hypothetical protein